MNKLILLSILYLLISCSENSDNNYALFQNKHQSDISFLDIDLNKIEFTDLPSSYLGQAKIANDTLFFCGSKVHSSPLIR